MHESIFEQLTKQYANFTKSEKKIVDYILSHKKESQYIGITDLSQQCDVAVSTISVFCRKLGLKNFNDLKLTLAKDMIPVVSIDSDVSAFGDITSEDTVEQIMQKTYTLHQTTLTQTRSLLNVNAVSQTVDILEKARHIVCLGQGNHSIVAQVAWARFSTISSKFKTIQDTDLQTISIATLKKGDVVLYFSYTGAIPKLLELAPIIKSRGAKLVLVTHFLDSPSVDYADAVLLYGGDEQPLLFGSTSVFLAQLYLIDVLFNEYCRRHYEDATQSRRFVQAALSHKSKP